jgi:hypothetical protein
VTAFLIGVGFVVLFVIWRRRRKAAKEGPKLWDGHFSGVASPYRTPAKHFHNRRSL